MTLNDKYKAVVAYFEQTMPDAQSELHFSNPFETIVAVILSAQCTDKRVNAVTPALFARYPDARAMSAATADDIFQYIKSCSYPNSKSRYLADTARMLVSDFGGEVPADIEQLQRLPGVGRKTANVVAAVAFGQDAMPVDTHIFRVSARIGLTINSKTPLDTERQLTKHLPREILSKAHHWLLLHGRYTCTARSPKCDKCGLTDICSERRKKKE
ncbi:MAG: endonuclease III [Bacteroidales bacterium]|nr:endonuclease III [Bacteroidales bacterium]